MLLRKYIRKWQCDRLENSVNEALGTIFRSNGCKRVFKYPLMAFGTLISVPMYDGIFDRFGTRIEKEMVKLKDRICYKR